MTAANFPHRFGHGDVEPFATQARQRALVLKEFGKYMLGPDGVPLLVAGQYFKMAKLGYAECLRDVVVWLRAHGLYNLSKEPAARLGALDRKQELRRERVNGKVKRRGAS